jgi:hypothetical protein
MGTLYLTFLRKSRKKGETMLSKTQKQKVRDEMKLLYSAFRGPMSHLDGAVDYLCEELVDDQDLFLFVSHVRKMRTRDKDFDGSKLECPTPVEIISAIRAKRPKKTKIEEKKQCDCLNGWVVLFSFCRMGKQHGYIRDNNVARCRCNGGNHWPRQLWYERFELSASGRWYDAWSDTELKSWVNDFFSTIAAWSTSQYMTVKVRWPSDKSLLIESMVDRGLWPNRLLAYEEG